MRRWIVPFVAVGLVVGGFIVAASRSGAPQPEYTPDPRLYVRQACERVVRARLKAPATARFSGEATTDNGAGLWTMTGVVDSENSFGALIRAGWTCQASFGTDGTTEVHYLTLG
jgi:hypothetical protein